MLEPNPADEGIPMTIRGRAVSPLGPAGLLRSFSCASAAPPVPSAWAGAETECPACGSGHPPALAPPWPWTP